MASTKFTKRDLNRYRKVYPYVRREPRMVLISDKEVTMEVGSIPFDSNGPVFKRYTFTENFPSVPFVTSVSIESGSPSPTDGNADVNVFVRLVTSEYVQIEVSQKFTGAVHFHAIWISS